MFFRFLAVHESDLCASMARNCTFGLSIKSYPTSPCLRIMAVYVLLGTDGPAIAVGHTKKERDDHLCRQALIVPQAGLADLALCSRCKLPRKDSSA